MPRNIPMKHHALRIPAEIRNVFSIAWCKIVTQCFFVAHLGVSHLPLDFLWYTLRIRRHVNAIFFNPAATKTFYLKHATFIYYGQDPVSKKI